MGDPIHVETRADAYAGARPPYPDAAAVGRLFGTFSDWSERSVAAATDLGGSVTEHYSSWLLVLAPSPRVASQTPARRPTQAVRR